MPSINSRLRYYMLSLAALIDLSKRIVFLYFLHAGGRGSPSSLNFADISGKILSLKYQQYYRLA